MKSIKNRLLKPFGIERAKVFFASTGDRYIHPNLFLVGSDGYSKVAIGFQSHRLDLADPISPEIPTHNGEGVRPNPMFDFGPCPYAATYGARFMEANSYGLGRLSAEVGRVHELKLLARFMAMISQATNKYNLRRLPHANCELSLWISALDSLGVPVEITRHAHGKDLDTWGWRETLPEKERSPAADYYKRKGNGGGAE